jgi:hypothetical protein
MTLTNYDIHFDIDANKILILKQPEANTNDGEKVISIEINATNKSEFEQLKNGFEQQINVTFAAQVQIESN